MRRDSEAAMRMVEVRVAANFFGRLRGLIGRPALAAGQGLWIEPCCAIHTFGMVRPIDVVFVDGDGDVLTVHCDLPPRRLRVCWGARGALELGAGFAARAGIYVGSRLNWEGGDRRGRRIIVAGAKRGRQQPSSGRQRSRMGGSGTVEWLLAAPLVLLLGLGTLQWGLLFNARETLDYALQQAARAGAVGAASADSIERGLAHGLLPYFGGAAAGQPVSLAQTAALTRVQAGKAAGWLAWRQLSPTRASFDDWGEPARDAMGDPVAGAIAIPNDNLRYRTRTIGAASRQTLADANLLKLELTVAVPLAVPLVGPLAVWWMEIVDHCRPPTPRMLGALPLPGGADGVGAAGTDFGQPWRCAYYRVRDEQGRLLLRWPVRVHAMVRMQSPARLSAHTPAVAELASGGAAGATFPGNGASGIGSDLTGGDQASAGAPTAAATTLLEIWNSAPLPGVARLNPNGAASTADGSATRGADFLQVGSDRIVPEPAACGPSPG